MWITVSDDEDRVVTIPRIGDRLQSVRVASGWLALQIVIRAEIFGTGVRGVRHGEALAGWVMEYGSGLLLLGSLVSLPNLTCWG